MIVNQQLQQGSEAWFKLRKGRPTASRFASIITPNTGKLASDAKVQAYMEELVADCFCPNFDGFMGNAATEHGNEFEPIARHDFEERTGLIVEQVGFCTRDDGIVGCSPDGLIRGADDEWIEGLEIKCPFAPKTLVGYLMAGELPESYRAQVHGSMAVTGLDRWHFYAYHPNLRAFHIVAERNDYTESVSEALDEFLIRYQAFRAEAVAKVAPEPVEKARDIKKRELSTPGHFVWENDQVITRHE